MPLQQLIYTKDEVQTSSENPATFILMVDADMYERHKKDKSIAIANVVDSFDILKYDNGKSGKMSRPSKGELKSNFGHANEDGLVEFMLNHGHVHGRPSVSNGEPGNMSNGFMP